MPERFHSKKVKLSDLQLDPQNPRFVTIPDTSQNGIIAYLLKNEEVIELSRSIASYGGLMPGELPIVCLEHDNYVVVEGNRRVCACKILLESNLAPAEFRASIPTITKQIRDELKRILVHIVVSREEAQIVLGIRHIEGIKRWPSVSKFMFFAKHFEAGKSIQDIETITGLSQSVITKSLRNHYFLQYILSLDCWTELEKQNLVNYSALHKRGVDRVLRLFRTAGNNELKISYDTRYNPLSELTDFGKIVEHIVRRVLNILPGKSEITTRTAFADIREDIKLWLPAPPPIAKATEETPAPAVPNVPLPETSTIGGTTAQPASTGELASTQPASTPTSPARGGPARPTEFYFENLSYAFTPATDQDRALVSLCEEIKKVSRGSAYRQYPLSSSFLTRALIEQACKRYLRVNDPVAYGKLCPVNRDSSLTVILRYFCNNDALFPDNNYHRIFVGLFPNGEGIKELMDLNMHHPGLSMPTGPALEGWVSLGLKNLLEYLLR